MGTRPRDETKRWTLDGEPVEDFAELDLSGEERAHAESLAPGAEMLVGGGAGAEFILRREAVHA